MSVNFLPRTRILTIHAKSIDANFSAAAANAVAAAYGEYVSATYASSAQRGFLLLQKQAEEASQSIQKLASSVLEFRKKSEVQAMVGHSSGEDALAVSDQQVVMDRLALGDARVVSLTDELSQVNQSIKGLSHRYRPGHPEMKELKTQQAYLKSQIDTLRGRIYDQWKRTHLEQQNSVEFSMLEQELEAMRRFHELLLAKMREIDFSRDSPGASIRVLRSARAPSNPSYPNKTINIIFGTVSGFVAGLLIAFLQAWSRSRLVSLSTPEDQFPAPLVGRLPHVPDVTTLGELLKGEDVSSQAAEAFKTLRTNVEAMLVASGDSNILITSPDRGDGKSTVSTALAQSFASLGRRTLLLDVDLRRGSLHQVLNTTQEHGLAEVLLGKANFEPTELSPNFSFLSCGHRVENPSELLASKAMKEVLLTAAREYDLVVLDSPPLLPVTDAALLARYAETRLMVLRSQRTHVEAATFQPPLSKILATS